MGEETIIVLNKCVLVQIQLYQDGEVVFTIQFEVISKSACKILFLSGSSTLSGLIVPYYDPVRKIDVQLNHVHLHEDQFQVKVA